MKPLLSAAVIQKRLERSTCLFNDLKNHGNRIFIFSNEKIFTGDPVFNKYNDYVVWVENDDSIYRWVSKTKHPASIMMLGVLVLNGKTVPPIWFEQNYRLRLYQIYIFCSLQRNFGYEVWRTLRNILPRNAAAIQMSSRLLWTAHGGRWNKVSSGRSARPSDFD